MSNKNIEINIGVLAVLIIALIVSVYFNLKPNNSSSQNSKTQEVSFEKKQDCATYKKQIEDSRNTEQNSKRLKILGAEPSQENMGNDMGNKETGEVFINE